MMTHIEHQSVDAAVLVIEDSDFSSFAVRLSVTAPRPAGAQPAQAGDVKVQVYKKDDEEPQIMGVAITPQEIEFR